MSQTFKIIDGLFQYGNGLHEGPWSSLEQRVGNQPGSDDPGGSFSAGPRIGGHLILEIWRGKGREAVQFVPSLCNTGGGGPKDVSGRNRVFCRGSFSRKGPPSAEGLSCLSHLSLHCAFHRLTQDFGFEPCVQSPCETFLMCTLDRQTLPTPLLGQDQYLLWACGGHSASLLCSQV